MRGSVVNVEWITVTQDNVTNLPCISRQPVTLVDLTANNGVDTLLASMCYILNSLQPLIALLQDFITEPTALPWF